MARRVRFKPSAKALCKVATSDDAKGRIHATDVGGKGMRAWLTKHGHLRHNGGQFYVLTRKGKKMADRACDVSFGR